MTASLDRFLITRRGCPFCEFAKKAVNYINLHLPYDKQIQIVDNYEYEEFGFMAHPFIEKMLDSSFDGYPYLYIDGGVIEPAQTELLILTIATKVSDDLLTDINFNGITIPN